MSNWSKSDYMVQEDEWEREGVLNPDWEKQQKKVFLAFRLKYSNNCIQIK